MDNKIDKKTINGIKSNSKVVLNKIDNLDLEDSESVRSLKSATYDLVDFLHDLADQSYKSLE